MGVAAVGADDMKCVYYKVEEKENREAHHRNVLGPVVVSAMHKSGLLGQCTMKQVQALWDLTCVGGELAWYVFFNSVLVCADADIKMLRVRAACCTVACCVGLRASKRGAVDQPMSCSALMCHVVGADCSPSFKTPQHALPNVREHHTLPTDRALYVPNSGRTPPPAITVAAHFWMERSQVWEVQGSATLLRATQWTAL